MSLYILTPCQPRHLSKCIEMYMHECNTKKTKEKKNKREKNAPSEKHVACSTIHPQKILACFYIYRKLFKLIRIWQNNTQSFFYSVCACCCCFFYFAILFYWISFTLCVVVFVVVYMCFFLSLCVIQFKDVIRRMTRRKCVERNICLFGLVCIDWNLNIVMLLVIFSNVPFRLLMYFMVNWHMLKTIQQKSHSRSWTKRTVESWCVFFRRFVLLMFSLKWAFCDWQWWGLWWKWSRNSQSASVKHIWTLFCWFSFSLSYLSTHFLLQQHPNWNISEGVYRFKCVLDLPAFRTIFIQRNKKNWLMLQGQLIGFEYRRLKAPCFPPTNSFINSLIRFENLNLRFRVEQYTFLHSDRKKFQRIKDKFSKRDMSVSAV